MTTISRKHVYHFTSFSGLVLLGNQVPSVPDWNHSCHEKRPHPQLFSQVEKTSNVHQGVRQNVMSLPLSFLQAQYIQPLFGYCVITNLCLHICLGLPSISPTSLWAMELALARSRMSGTRSHWTWPLRTGTCWTWTSVLHGWVLLPPHGQWSH